MQTYEINKITNSLYSINENILGNKFPILIYLIVGGKKAAVIDTGLGTNDLRKTIELITKLPIVVLHSHGHLDHVGANALFDEIYLNFKEYKLIGNGYNTNTEQRLKFIKQHLKDSPEKYEYIKEHIVKSKNIDYKNIDDGDIIDLGGIELTAVSTPGHTPGCISYINRKDHYAFTGDAIADIHWFDNGNSIGVKGFLDTLNHFEENAIGVKNIYAAHLPNPFGIELVHDLQKAAKEVINGADDKLENADYEFLIHGNLFAHRHGKATIYYNKENKEYT